MYDVLLVDAKHALWRAADAHNDLTVDGNPSGAVYGFLQILCKIHQLFGGDVVVCWDDWLSGPAHRKALYPAYKEKKQLGVLDEQQAEFIKSMHIQQFQLMEVLEKFGILQTYSPGWEADDVLGTCARKFGDTGSKVGILSGDRDLLQCVRENVNLIRPRPKGEHKVETPESVKEEWGVSVEQFVDLKALMGDAGDNIPGCPGVGKVTAAKILQTYGRLPQTLEAAHNGGESWTLSEKVREKLNVNKDLILLSQKLAQINCDVQIKSRPRRRDRNHAMDSMVRLRFKTILISGRFDRLWKMGEV